MKKMLSIVLAVVMTILTIPMTATTVSAETDGYYTYTVTDDCATITGVDKSISGDITIPDTLGGYPVTSIGDEAFWSCTSLTSVTIPDSVTSIGYMAFHSCINLTSVTIPDIVISISFDVFKGTRYYDDLSNWENDVLYIGKHLIKAKDTVRGICEIKNETLTIADRAFYCCDSLINLTTPDSVTYIGNEAFYGCSNLTDITIPDNVTNIGKSAFEYCRNLTSISVSERNNAYKSIDDVLFSKDGRFLLKYPIGKINSEYIIPNSVTNISDKAFYECKNLNNITIHDNVTSIGEYAFYETGYYNNSSNWENDVLYIGKHLVVARL